jgi:cellulose biosynthesis protein BcsQ
VAVDAAALRSILDQAVGVYELVLEQNPFGDVTVVVIAPRFDALDQPTRADLVAPLFNDPLIERVLTLTPAEAEARVIADDLDEPLWPEALARGSLPVSPTFPTDLDIDIAKPIVSTFYSLRGGVGRSTALAYTGLELAGRGRSVVMVDMDFEAPGLAALFAVEDAVPDGGGLPDVLLALERGDRVDLAEHVIRIDESQELYLLPAGRAGAEYARVLSLLTPELWLREEPNPLWRLLDGLQATAFSPDVILIDSRTGLNPLSAPLLFDASDLAVVCFFPHPQAERGTHALARALLASHTRRRADGVRFAPEPRFLVSPIPAGASEVRRKYEVRALDWVTQWLSVANETREGANALVPEDLTLFVPYREGAAITDRISRSAKARADYVGLADWLEALLPLSLDSAADIQTPADKLSILDSLEFSPGTAENQPRFAESFVPTETMQRALTPTTPLVLGRKGTGKTAVFRRLLETAPSAVPVTAPDALKTRAPWALSPEGYETLEAAASENWRLIWLSLIGVAYWANVRDRDIQAVPAELIGAFAPVQEALTELKTVQTVRRLVDVPDSTLILNDWLTRPAMPGSEAAILLFDGLDTGFGSSPDQRQRRQRAISALLPLALAAPESGGPLSFKVLLREDIWRSMTFQNKSHFFGRSVTLQWQDQIDYLRTVVKQAVLSHEFGQSVANRIATDKPIERWSGEEVLIAWSALVGERMKGGKTTFTRNWVWNRLADGNGDHSPRSLLQLFFTAKEWEIREERDAPYERSIIRPRALIESLGVVSAESLGALEEEFSELRPMFELLRSIGRTPLDAGDLDSQAELIPLAREVGLLEVYEGAEDDVRRYRIPDLLRLGLGMTRMGQI